MRTQTALAITALLFTSTVLAAATTPRDSDGVPMADPHGEIVVSEPVKVSNGFRVAERKTRLISVDDKKLTPLEFLKAYCLGKQTNKTCAATVQIGTIDSASGPKPLR